MATEAELEALRAIAAKQLRHQARESLHAANVPGSRSLVDRYREGEKGEHKLAKMLQLLQAIEGGDATLADQLGAETDLMIADLGEHDLTGRLIGHGKAQRALAGHDATPSSAAETMSDLGIVSRGSPVPSDLSAADAEALNILRREAGPASRLVQSQAYEAPSLQAMDLADLTRDTDALIGDLSLDSTAQRVGQVTGTGSPVVPDAPIPDDYDSLVRLVESTNQMLFSDQAMPQEVVGRLARQKDMALEKLNALAQARQGSAAAPAPAAPAPAAAAPVAAAPEGGSLAGEKVVVVDDATPTTAIPAQANAPDAALEAATPEAMQSPLVYNPAAKDPDEENRRIVEELLQREQKAALIDELVANGRLRVLVTQGKANEAPEVTLEGADGILSAEGQRYVVEQFKRGRFAPGSRFAMPLTFDALPPEGGESAGPAEVKPAAVPANTEGPLPQANTPEQVDGVVDAEVNPQYVQGLIDVASKAVQGFWGGGAAADETSSADNQVDDPKGALAGKVEREATDVLRRNPGATVTVEERKGPNKTRTIPLVKGPTQAGTITVADLQGPKFDAAANFETPQEVKNLRAQAQMLTMAAMRGAKPESLWDLYSGDHHKRHAAQRTSYVNAARNLFQQAGVAQREAVKIHTRKRMEALAKFNQESKNLRNRLSLDLKAQQSNLKAYNEYQNMIQDAQIANQRTMVSLAQLESMNSYRKARIVLGNRSINAANKRAMLQSAGVNKSEILKLRAQVVSEMSGIKRQIKDAGNALANPYLMAPQNRDLKLQQEQLYNMGVQRQLQQEAFLQELDKAISVTDAQIGEATKALQSGGWLGGGSGRRPRNPLPED
tara:strand:- start:1823 stop:4342 length:2520 start_codon:yes stop_codon:yes gene_type:complete